MKKLTIISLSSLVLFSINACSSSVVMPDLNTNQVNASSTETKAAIYPFDTNKDFYPLFNTNQWKYDVYDTNNKFVTSLTKTLDVSNEKSLELDKKNNFYLVALKKTYSNLEVKDPEIYEYVRRRDNQLAFGKIDNLTYYPEKQKSMTERASFNVYDFRPFSDFNSGKLETVKVKAGTFQCLKSEFTLNLDKYTIWYAKGIGEVKRIKQGYFNGFRYELSEYNSLAKQFVLNKEVLSLKDLSADIQNKVNSIKTEFIKINQLPDTIFAMKASKDVFIENKVIKDNYKKSFEITFTNKSTAANSKDNVSLTVYVGVDGTLKGVVVTDDNNGKPIYQGKVVDKLPTLVKG